MPAGASPSLPCRGSPSKCPLCCSISSRLFFPQARSHALLPSDSPLLTPLPPSAKLPEEVVYSVFTTLNLSCQTQMPLCQLSLPRSHVAVCSALDADQSAPSSQVPVPSRASCPAGHSFSASLAGSPPSCALCCPGAPCLHTSLFPPVHSATSSAIDKPTALQCIAPAHPFAGAHSLPGCNSNLTGTD